MKTTLQSIGTAIDRLIYFTGVMFLASYALEHWRRPAAILFWGFLGLCAMHYVWKFVVQPFRAGLRGE